MLAGARVSTFRFGVGLNRVRAAHFCFANVLYGALRAFLKGYGRGIWAFAGRGASGYCPDMLTTKHVLQTAKFMAQTEPEQGHFTAEERFALALIESAKRMPKSVRDEIGRLQRPPR